MGAKGGIGKTLIASTMAQYLRERERKVDCIDLDYKNASFSQYAKLNVTCLDLETDGDIEKRKFDVLIERIAAADNDTDFILDSGGNIYIPLNNYMRSNDVYNLLLDMGHRILLHVPIMGGSELDETMNTLNELCAFMPDAARIAVWLNTYHGIIEKDGKSFEQSSIYKNHKKRIYTLVSIPKFAADMRQDVSEMYKNKMTYEEAIASPSFPLMPRQRIKMAKNKLFSAMALAKVCD
jgi:hypothetical protein